MTGIKHTVDSKMDDLISDLQLLIRQPSISTTGQGLIECAHLLANIMRKAGIDSELLYLDNTKEDIPPIVYGEVKSKANPHGKTILFYNSDNKLYLHKADLLLVQIPANLLVILQRAS